MNIHHFHIDHNAPCLPPKIWDNHHVLNFPWDDCNTQENCQTVVMQNLGEGGEQGALWSV